MPSSVVPLLERLRFLDAAGVDQLRDGGEALQARQVVGPWRRGLGRRAHRQADQGLTLLRQAFGEPALLLAGDFLEVGLELAEREDAEIVETERQVLRRHREHGMAGTGLLHHGQQQAEQGWGIGAVAVA